MQRTVLAALVLVVAGCEALFDVDEKRLAPPTTPTPSPPVTSQPSSKPTGPRPPGRPSNPASGPAERRAFAAQQLFFGAVDPATGERDPNAWRRMGYDIDGLNTTPELAASSRAPGTCKRPEGADLDALVDGVDGRDNNFGSQLLKVAATVTSGPEGLEVGTTKSIAMGAPTFVVALNDLNEGPDDPELSLGVYVSAEGKPPHGNGVHRYAIDSRTVVPGSIEAKMTFRRAYMTNNTVVSGDFNEPSEIPFILPLDPAVGTIVTTPLSLTFVLELDPKHETVLSSTISMILTTNDVAKIFEPSAIRFGLARCGEDGKKLLFDLARLFSDLRSDRPGFLDPSGETECDAMSVAMGVRWMPVRSPLVENVTVVPPRFDPCAP